MNNNNEEYDQEEEFDQEEFRRIAELAQAETRKTFQRLVKANTDNRTKGVGERVLVWDCSRLTDLETSEINRQNNVHIALNNYYSIVIAENQRYIAEVKTFAGDFSKNLDLIIWNEQLKMKFRTSSEFVKIKD